MCVASYFCYLDRPTIDVQLENRLFFYPCVLSATVLAGCSVISSAQNAHFFLKIFLGFVLFCFISAQFACWVSKTEIVICHFSVFSELKSAVAECLNGLTSWYSQYFNIFSISLRSMASCSHETGSTKINTRCKPVQSDQTVLLLGPGSSNETNLWQLSISLRKVSQLCCEAEVVLGKRREHPASTK